MNSLLWQDPTWQAQARAWIRAECARLGLTLTSEIEQPHTYAWSTVMRVQTDAGLIYFKATANETLYEIALTGRLARLSPTRLPDLLATDISLGWMLMRDGGEQLRASIRPNKTIKPWEPVIALYADLQIELSNHANEFLALGIPDHRPSALPTLYTQLLTDTPSLLIDQPKGLTSAEVSHLHELAPRLQEVCEELTDFGIPNSINHGDFHDGNVLVKDGHITFFDWGDANITHPFVSLRTFFVSCEIAIGLDDFTFTHEMSALLDIYLARWHAFGSLETLRAAYQLSKPVASVSKALAWHTTISRLDGELREEYAGIVPEVLREFVVYIDTALS